MTTPHELDHKLISAVDQLCRAFRVARQHLATEIGVSVLQVHIIEQLDRLGDRRVGELANQLAVSQPTVSDALKALTDKGYVDRRSSSTDRRVTLATLTPLGRTTAERIISTLSEAFAVSGQDDDTCHTERAAALAAMLVELRRMQHKGLLVVNRTCLTCNHFRPHTNGDPARCSLMRVELAAADLRVDCLEHEPTPTAS